MTKHKLKLEDVEIESFVTAATPKAEGTVRANAMRTEDTCRGQTGLCTGCTPIACY
ncbi:pinensin family lanthipeptide [Longimicrobium terrae]|uniref:Gallidermin/nisin family lantibiotic n=1 Tax=Longimicrobium terrae TaxID=1639882 RepID=A0A841H1X9_9BACT|nr:pinensin family lanthipeptide [Longimicrobium terrae]MBB4637630.1 hypothetical protein [Longimicrobium terrae]MBB6072027.1 hypothetical protein [Longimicrobium terrae]NNC29886.1 hypothetical protein [Longimicrobium terrae]